MIEDNIWLNYPAQYVIGADEVGRGSFAGPIVACAVKINSYDKEHLVDVKDSKKLTEKKRNSIFEIINNTEISYSISVCDNKQIDMYGIQKSNQAVLINSINKVKTGGEKIYIDHFKVDIPESESITRGATSSHHGPYDLGYTRATMASTEGC